ncbi:MAG: alanine racemase [Gammaproteobacteria bacterium]|nr:alanine racemase [Gammaproteobacteria bacterium]
MSRPTFAIIDSGAFVANYRYAKSLAPGARALAVVKANAYGHGAVRLARALGDEADAFGVACSEEAVELREAGIGNPILVLEGAFSADEVDLAARLRLDLTVHSERQLEWLLAARPAHAIDTWIKIDTGMHRLGFAPEDAAGVYRRLQASANVGGITLMSHFARADETDVPATAQQLGRFLHASGGIVAPRSLANSAAVLAWPDSHADWIRPGIMLYGSSPLDGGANHDAPLRPVMRLESQLIAIHQLAAGESIGYGGRFTCAAPTRVGVVAIGYADGYPRHAPDGTPVAVGGRLTRLIGRVSMDMITVDLTALPDAQIGDTVQLWGDRVQAADVARHCDTIAYELFTRISRRVHFIYR